MTRAFVLVVALAWMCLTTPAQGESDEDLLDALGRALGNGAEYRRALVEITRSNAASIRLRQAGLNALAMLNSRENRWVEQRKFYVTFLGQDLPEPLPEICANHLARVLACETGNTYLARQGLGELAAKSDGATREALNAQVSAMTHYLDRRPDLAALLPVGVLTEDPSLGIGTPYVGPPCVFSPDRRTAHRLAASEAIFTWELLSDGPWFRAVMRESTPTSFSRARLADIEWIERDPLVSQCALMGRTGIDELRPYSPYAGEGFKAFCVAMDEGIARSVLGQGHACAEAKDWAGARSAYVRVIQEFGVSKVAPSALEGLVQTFVKEGGDDPLEKKVGRFNEWARNKIADKDALAAAEFYVCQYLYRDKAYPQALEAINAFKERYKGDKLRLQRAKLIEGLVQFRSDELENALVLFRELVAEEAEDDIAAQAQFLIGWVHLSFQDHGEAREALEAVVKKYPGTDHAKKAQELLDRLSKQ